MTMNIFFSFFLFSAGQNDQINLFGNFKSTRQKNLSFLFSFSDLKIDSMHLVHQDDLSIPPDNWKPPFVTLETTFVEFDVKSSFFFSSFQIFQHGKFSC